MLILPIFIPIIAGILLPILKPERKTRRWYVTAVTAVTAVIAVAAAAASDGAVTLFRITEELTISFAADKISLFFAAVICVTWLITAVYSYEYMEHEGAEDRFYGFYLATLGVLIGLSFASNLVTLYLFFECVTFAAVPLVLHSLKKEAVSAALKYLFYSVFGALLALFGVFFIWHFSAGHDFILGGVIDPQAIAGHEKVFHAAVFLMIVGFGTKAGMYPMHGWLPTAHPVAPAPASALLSGIIAKAGIIAVVRVVYYTVGAEYIAGTWVQTVWMILALVTVFMGSIMAYKEDLLKKRLAYSTVSNISYIMLGLACLTPAGLVGALTHVAAHAAAKVTLFCAAGSIILREGKTHVSELEGIGKRMPLTMWAFTLASLSLIGIPPFAGFVSKWFIAVAAVSGDYGAFSVLIPAVLLVSALLTAGYLLPPVINGFFPKKGYDYSQPKTEAPPVMTAPMLLLSIIGLLLGVFGQALFNWLSLII
ncbi:MAG: proton-conducting membrane transporter [Oscillospiraceae bacterium]|nr:proton-conducting membrane transporter [Oscillospiraceae bacterium]